MPTAGASAWSATRSRDIAFGASSERLHRLRPKTQVACARALPRHWAGCPVGVLSASASSSPAPAWNSGRRRARKHHLQRTLLAGIRVPSRSVAKKIAHEPSRHNVLHGFSSRVRGSTATSLLTKSASSRQAVRTPAVSHPSPGQGWRGTLRAWCTARGRKRYLHPLRCRRRRRMLPPCLASPCSRPLSSVSAARLWPTHCTNCLWWRLGLRTAMVCLGCAHRLLHRLCRPADLHRTADWHRQPPTICPP